MPAATLRFGSPNACNMCHEDEDAAWADRQVRRWHEADYQEAVLEVAGLVDAARRGQWDRLNVMLAYVGSAERDEVFTVSLLRLLRACENEAKWPAVTKALEEDASPLVRAAAAQTLEGHRTTESLRALSVAAGDETRLVRVRAAAALAAIPAEQLQDVHRAPVRLATKELMTSLHALPDDYASHYNLGNFHMDRREFAQALSAYQMAIKLRPDFMPPYVNMAFAHNATGSNDRAEASFREALALDPNSPVVHLNLGMLLAELNRLEEAEHAFRAALKTDPNLAGAAYNLGVLLAGDRPEESLKWCRRAFRLQPNEGKYGYTYAFFLHRAGQSDRAVTVLEGMVNRTVPSADVYALLASIYLQRGDREKAIGVYRAAQANERLDPQARSAFNTMMLRLQQ
jgi:tetratricopeptide (TPR) repeat protein